MRISYNQIMGFKSYLDPRKFGIPKDYEADVIDFIKDYKDKVKYVDDIFWLLLRNDFLNDKDLRLYGVWCVKQVEPLMTDKRSKKALVVAEQFAFGEADENALEDAYLDAWAAAVASSSPVSFTHYPAWAAYDIAEHFSSTAALHAAITDAKSVIYEDAMAEQLDKLVEVFQKPNGEWYERSIK